MLIHYACTQQKNPFKMLDQDTSVYLVNVNSKDDNDYYIHCRSVIEHPIFGLFFGSMTRNCGHCKDLKIEGKLGVNMSKLRKYCGL